jgi:hypothetical protein
MTGLDGRQESSSLFVVKAGAMLDIVQRSGAMLGVIERHVLRGLDLSRKAVREAGRDEPITSVVGADEDRSRMVEVSWTLRCTCCSGHHARRDLSVGEARALLQERTPSSRSSDDATCMIVVAANWTFMIGNVVPHVSKEFVHWKRFTSGHIWGWHVTARTPSSSRR